MTDSIADLLTQLRNANSALLPDLVVAHSRLKERIALVLKKEGYIADCAVDGKIKKTLKLKLKFKGRRGVIEGVRRISTPGLRRYVGATEIPRVLGGMGTAVLSTPKGIMTGAEAKRLNLGGELLCYVW